MSAARTIAFTLNGRKETAAIETHWNLVELLNGFGLGGARESCGQGLCGCCTVLIDGTAVSGCLYLAVAADGKAITTIESLDEEGALSPVQQAFIDSGAFQCGFCTPGFVVGVRAFLNMKPKATEEEIRKGLNGNLCRCGTYANVIQAALKVVKGGA